jgi:hypothetical protein
MLRRRAWIHLRDCVADNSEFLALGAASLAFLAMTTMAQQKAEMSNMKLVGYSDLQGRNAFVPVIQKQGNRWIAYVSHHGDQQMRANRLTGKPEPNGTSILDVTVPTHPKYLFHIPGQAEGGAPFLRVCGGDGLPRAKKGSYYLLRALGGASWEMWDVTDPSRPSRLNVIVDGLKNTRNAWWECDSGIAYLVGGPLDWRDTPMGEKRYDALSHALIYDLSDPEHPVFLRTFGRAGQQRGSLVAQPPSGLHGVVSTGPKGNRVYFSNGTAQDGVLQIVDREKLLNGPKQPTDENLRYPIIAEIELAPDMGTNTSFPLSRMYLPEFSRQQEGSVRDFLAVIGGGHADLYECQDSRQMMRIFDITTESKPVGVATWTVKEQSGNFCTRGGYFSTHASNTSLTPIYYDRILFIAHHNAGVRAVDIRDPYHPREIGYYIPAVNNLTTKSCVGEGATQHCRVVIDTNNVEVDDRGYIYLADSHDTGLHIVALTGAARQFADFSKADR